MDKKEEKQVKYPYLGRRVYMDNYSTVDLGLPSGTLWGTKNIGAETEYDVGLYFQWGDTVGYGADQVGVDKVFSSSNYKYYDLGYTKYDNTDGLTTLELEDDAAHVNIGDNWRMPTYEQIQELIDNTSQEYSSDKWGYIKFISKTDASKYVIFPSSGHAYMDSIYDVWSKCYCWSSSLYMSYIGSAHILTLDVSGSVYIDISYRFFGRSVRGVLNQ